MTFVSLQFFFLYRDCTHRIIFCQLNILEHKEKKMYMKYRNCHDFSRDGEKMEFSVTVGTLYITSNVFIKKGNRRTNAKIPTFFPLIWHLLFLYTWFIYIQRKSVLGGGGVPLWNKFSRTGSFHFLCLYRHFSKHKYSNTIKAQTIQSQQLQ